MAQSAKYKIASIMRDTRGGTLRGSCIDIPHKIYNIASEPEGRIPRKVGLPLFTHSGTDSPVGYIRVLHQELVNVLAILIRDS